MRCAWPRSARSVAVALRSEIDDLIERWYGQGRSAMGAIVETAEGEKRRCRRRPATAGSRLRGAGHPAGEPDHTSARRDARVRHPHRAVREPPERALPHRRRAARGREPAGQSRRRGDLAHQDHGEPRHRRAPPAAGRPHQAARAGQGDRPARRRPCRRCTASRW